MDKIQLLKTRRQSLIDSGKEIRKIIDSLTDEKSFVEQSVYSYSQSEFYEDGAQGEGVVCGFATIDGNPFYIAAQNFAVLSGGISKAGCIKILKCLEAAEKSLTPVIFILNSHGVRMGEGITALENFSAVLNKAASLKGTILQYAIISGDCFGQASLLAANADFTFMYEDSVLTHASPFVLSAKKGVNVSKEKIGGANFLKNSNLVAFKVKNHAEIKSNILKIADLLYGCVVSDYSDLNRTFSELNKNCTDQTLIESVFDEDSYIETGANFSPEIRCILGRVGGISCAAAVFSSSQAAVNANSIRKLKDFAELAACFELPFINFVNSGGIEQSAQTLDSLALKNTADYLYVLSAYDNAKISVIYGSATGTGYTLFAAKSAGFDYSFAFADAKIALFDSAAGAEIELGATAADKTALAKKYADENSDPVHAAKDGYIDNIIEPADVKKYLISTLQMLLR